MSTNIFHVILFYIDLLFIYNVMRSVLHACRVGTLKEKNNVSDLRANVKNENGGISNHFIIDRAILEYFDLSS